MLFYSNLFIRFVSTEDYITFSQEALLCVISCLNILKAVSSDCNFKLLCDCLRSIEVWVSLLDNSTVPEQGEKGLADKIKQMVAESFDVVMKWLRKSVFFGSKIPWYSKDETEKELEVHIFYFDYLIPFVQLNMGNQTTTWYIFYNKWKTEKMLFK